MAQGHDFQLQRSPMSKAADQAMSEGVKQSNHALDVMSHNHETSGFLPRMELLEGISPLNSPKWSSPGFVDN